MPYNILLIFPGSPLYDLDISLGSNATRVPFGVVGGCKVNKHKVITIILNVNKT